MAEPPCHSSPLENRRRLGPALPYENAGDLDQPDGPFAHEQLTCGRSQTGAWRYSKPGSRLRLPLAALRRLHRSMSSGLGSPSPGHDQSHC